MYDRSLRWDLALARPHTALRRVEVWDRGDLVEKSLPIVDGQVTDKWATGIRRSLTLSVPPSPKWREVLSSPTIELRPYRGINFGTGAPEMIPLGRFPAIFDADSADPSQAISISADDRWSLLVADTFYGPTVSGTGFIRAEIARLIGQSVLGPVTDLATSTATMTTRLYDGTRHDAIAELCESVGAEVFVGRSGEVILRDRPATDAAVYAVAAGEMGTMVDLSAARDWSKVYNIVVVRPTASNVAFAPVIVSITDTADPAHPSRIGRRVYRYDTSLVADPAQAKAAGLAMLRKLSAPQRSLSVSCIPNAALDASDCLAVVWPDGGREAAQIDQVNHPLGTGSSAQQITTVLNRVENP